uniref:Uncharacterized protein n=1 Tax=Candidatus Kentrum sp. UNK TaxID=2126344 RepID=A0A451ABW9_9GAMM|nr:MAG: hypothetical protein BECKUNK1418G_GA0071005_103428 [Candidatus Kentron sp. UNK]VFK70855.1 MAG: hypothetical protein BECKUNK1418H_GA0071006_104029 [Candidatus Kentron sp. UNK]
MSVLFIDYKIDGKWNKRWETLFPPDPIVEEWSNEIEGQISEGLLQRHGQPVTLVVVHDNEGVGRKLKQASDKARTKNVSLPFRLKVSTTSSTGKITDDGWGCISAKSVPSGRDLSCLSSKFRRLVDELDGLWNLNPAEIDRNKLKQAWSIWNDDDDVLATMSEPSPEPTDNQLANSPAKSTTRLADQKLRDLLIGFSIVTKAWLFHHKGSEAKTPRHLANRIGTPVWWWSTLGLADDKESAKSTVESFSERIRQKQTSLKEASGGDDEPNRARQKAQVTCEEMISLIEATLTGSIDQERAETTLAALERDLEMIVKA